MNLLCPIPCPLGDETNVFKDAGPGFGHAIAFRRAKRYFSMRPWTAADWSYTSWRDNRVFPCQRLSAPAVDTGTNAW
jgi:hypothetical protein